MSRIEMKNLFKLSALSFAILTLASCAGGQTRKDVDQKLAGEQPIANTTEMNKDSRATIQNSPTLTDDQKTKLLSIQAATAESLKNSREELFKLHELLVQEVTSKNYSDDRVNDVKKRLRKLVNARVDTLFKAIDQANDVLGRVQERNKNSLMMHDMFVDHLMDN
jgi:hypothetical protein